MVRGFVEQAELSKAKKKADEDADARKALVMAMPEEEDGRGLEQWAADVGGRPFQDANECSNKPSTMLKERRSLSQGAADMGGRPFLDPKQLLI
jgi:hypothetical protein